MEKERKRGAGAMMMKSDENIWCVEQQLVRAKNKQASVLLRQRSKPNSVPLNIMQENSINLYYIFLSHYIRSAKTEPIIIAYITLTFTHFGRR